MQGVLLAGGTGTRLSPLTNIINKHLLPIYNKPMIYFPISTLMLCGIRQILLITSPAYLNDFKKILGDGSQYGLEISFAIQEEPKGIAQGIEIASHFTDDDICLILGDNIFYGSSLRNHLINAVSQDEASVFAYHVSNPADYGVIEFDAEHSIISIEEKPKIPKSNFAIPGIYFFPRDVFKKVDNINPSNRGELEIISVLEKYKSENRLKVEVLSRGIAWLDTGTFEGLHEASSFVKTIEERQGYKLACLEEIAYRNGWLSQKQIMRLIEQTRDRHLAEYLSEIIVDK